MKKPVLRDIALDSIDPPPAPIRAHMDTTELAELARSISVLGIIEPLIVVPDAGRYKVIAGHRRYLAAIMAGLLRVPCVIFDEQHEALDGVQLHDNLYREDLNAVEEGRKFQSMLPSCGDDVDTLAGLIRQSRGYVEDRLLLLTGDAEVCDALAARQISFAVAKELNKVNEQAMRRMFLTAAVDGGATARLVMGWRVRANAGARAEEIRTERAAAAAEAPAPATDPASIFACFYCQGSENPHDLQLFYVHSSCLAIVRRLLAGALAAAGKP